jgi:glycosyltransferase involved in cell wall biosynthesis
VNLPLVSIIVSCYNAEKYIAATLESLIIQTYHKTEIIVVDDGSTDMSANIIKSFKDDRLKYYYQKNKGQCAALNLGFNLSSGSLIKFYDADDILHPYSIGGQVESLEGKSESALSFIEWKRFFNDELPDNVNEISYNTIHRDCFPVEHITFSDGTPMFQCGMWLIPRTLFFKTGLWDKRLSLINDTEFFSRILTKASNLIFSDKGITFYRTNFKSSSLSSDFSKKGIKSAILSIDLTARWFLQIENSERIKRVIVNSYVMILEWSFPAQITYCKIIEKRLAAYPKTYITYTKSGKAYNLILHLFGWKIARRLAKVYYKVRYNKG